MMYAEAFFAGAFFMLGMEAIAFTLYAIYFASKKKK